MEGLTDADDMYTEGSKVFEIKNSEEYHDLFVKWYIIVNDTLFLADIYKNFWNMCHEIYELDPACFLNAPGLTWQASLKKTKVKLNLN